VDDRRAARVRRTPRHRAVQGPVDLDRRRIGLDPERPAEDAAELPDVDRGEHRVPGEGEAVDALAEPELDAALPGPRDERVGDPARTAFDAWVAVALRERGEHQPERAPGERVRRQVAVQRVPQHDPALQLVLRQHRPQHRQHR